VAAMLGTEACRDHCFPPKIIVPFPFQVTDLCLLKTVLTGSGDRLGSCSTNKGGFRRLHRSKYVMLTNPPIVGVKNEWNYDMIYLLTAIGLSPGGSSTVHIYTQTIHRTTQGNNTQNRTYVAIRIHKHNNKMHNLQK
jgi:hypothetical protein